MDRAQRVNEWNGVICFVIMFTPRVMAIKMSKWVIIFFVFFADDNKTLVTAGTEYLSASGRSYRVLQKMVWLLGFGVCEILSVETAESAKDSWSLVYLRVDILQMVAQNLIIHSIS